MIPKPKKARKPSRKSIVQKADRAFSSYIIARDGRRCVQCGTTENLTCGHIYTRTHYTTRWNEHNAMCQCAGHNMRHEFDFQPFYEKAIRRWGRIEMQTIHDLFEQAKPVKTAEILEIAEHYERCAKELRYDQPSR